MAPVTPQLVGAAVMAGEEVSVEAVLALLEAHAPKTLGELERAITASVPRPMAAALETTFGPKTGDDSPRARVATAVACGLAARKALQALGFDARSALYANSTCPDEVNRKRPSWDLLLGAETHMSFNLGGLGGLPAVGKTGFKACASHVSDAPGACIFVLCASHAGVAADGRVGVVRRDGQGDKASTCCGAACGALDWAQKTTTTTTTPVCIQADPDDAQMDACKMAVAREVSESRSTEKRPLSQGSLAEVVFRAAFDKLCALVPSTLALKAPVVVLGGVQLNTDVGSPDYFAAREFAVFDKVDGSSGENAKPGPPKDEFALFKAHLADVLATA